MSGVSLVAALVGPWHTVWILTHIVSGQCLLLVCLVFKTRVSGCHSSVGLGMLQSQWLDTPVSFGHYVRVWHTVWHIVHCSPRYGHV